MREGLLVDGVNKKSLIRALDIDGDGKVDIKDFLALLQSRSDGPSDQDPLVAKSQQAWTGNRKRLETLSNAIREKVHSDRSLIKKSAFSRSDRKMNAILRRLELQFNDQGLEDLRKTYIGCLEAIKNYEDLISVLYAALALTNKDEQQKTEVRLGSGLIEFKANK